MNKIKTQIICIFSFIILGLMISCEDPNAPDYEYFLIKVNSIQIPEIIEANKPFEIQFSGLIGHNGCYHFSEFKTEKQGNNILLEAWGKHNRKSRICSDVMVYMDEEKLTYNISSKGNYTLKIKQSDGTFLLKEILVE